MDVWTFSGMTKVKVLCRLWCPQRSRGGATEEVSQKSPSRSVTQHKMEIVNVGQVARFNLT